MAGHATTIQALRTDDVCPTYGETLWIVTIVKTVADLSETCGDKSSKESSRLPVP